MSQSQLLDYAQTCLLLVLRLSLIPILVATVIGILVSLLQALTQIQEQTLGFAVKLIAEKYFNGLVSLSRGEREGTPKKPSPDMVYAVMRELDADPATTLFVGDSDVDFDTAVNADLDACLVDWGFRDRDLLESRLKSRPADRRGTVVSTAEELLRFILS